MSDSAPYEMPMHVKGPSAFLALHSLEFLLPGRLQRVHDFLGQKPVFKMTVAGARLLAACCSQRARCDEPLHLFLLVIIAMNLHRLCR